MIFGLKLISENYLLKENVSEKMEKKEQDGREEEPSILKEQYT